MGDQAKISSIEAIANFRANLIAYVQKTKPVLEDVYDEVSRTRVWLESDRRIYWENQVRRRRRAFEDAQGALFSARISNLREVTTAEQAQVAKAKAALGEAEEKLRRVNKWLRDFDQRVQPVAKELDALRSLLGTELTKGAAHLHQLLQRLEAYRQVAGAVEQS